MLIFRDALLAMQIGSFESILIFVFWDSEHEAVAEKKPFVCRKLVVFKTAFSKFYRDTAELENWTGPRRRRESLITNVFTN